MMYDNPRRGPARGVVAGVALMAVGAGLMLVAVPLAMSRAANSLARDSGVGDPAELAGRISHLLAITFWGEGVALAGLVVFVAALVAQSRAERKRG